MFAQVKPRDKLNGKSSCASERGNATPGARGGIGTPSFALLV
jgi:hypothetical protein